jgi:multicomponent Na+:H+ antiporter subunit C
MTIYLVVALFIVGLWGLLAKPNLLKKVMALGIVNSAVVILFVYFGSLSGETAPIGITDGTPVVDPVPQALMLTAIVVGVCVLALALALVYRLYRIHGTLDLRKIERATWGSDG